MDGNSRYAQASGWRLSAGHEAGVAALRRAVAAAGRFGVTALTVYAFSEENWGRDASEVAFLLGLFERALAEELPALEAAAVRLRFIGERGRLPRALVRAMESAEARTAGNGGLLLTVAVSYSSHADIAAAAARLAAAAAAGAITPAQITPAALAAELSTAGGGAGPVDLLIRTSDTQRLSNFLLWELAYAELVFEPALWPAFGGEHLERALRQFAARERRFGGRRPAGGGGGAGGGGVR
ncbi:MAG: Undecaprenyl pyrophosphate synthetase [Monoraphidium minutum]|nr:MAG: Undecaprenyl pyrophosphate synthetase [Monoraphidium minutum]